MRLVQQLAHGPLSVVAVSSITAVANSCFLQRPPVWAGAGPACFHGDMPW
jgi:hypothetical protein